MMNEIIDVEYKEIIPLEEKSTEELKTEVNMREDVPGQDDLHKT